MIKEFTYNAPKEYLDTSGTDLKEVTTTYHGAETIWVFVDKETRGNVRFVSDGDLPEPTPINNDCAVKLSSDNPNHIILMDMLSSSNGHSHTQQIDEELNQVGDIKGAEDFVFVYTRPEHHDTFHTYELKDTTVSESGVVTYQWKAPHITWEVSERIVTLRLAESMDKLKDPVVSVSPEATKKYQRHIALLEYIRDNFVGKVGAWKVNIPLASDV